MSYENIEAYVRHWFLNEPLPVNVGSKARMAAAERDAARARVLEAAEARTLTAERLAGARTATQQIEAEVLAAATSEDEARKALTLKEERLARIEVCLPLDPVRPAEAQKVAEDVRSLRTTVEQLRQQRSCARQAVTRSVDKARRDQRVDLGNTLETDERLGGPAGLLDGLSRDMACLPNDALELITPDGVLARAQRPEFWLEDTERDLHAAEAALDRAMAEQGRLDARSACERLVAAEDPSALRAERALAEARLSDAMSYTQAKRAAQETAESALAVQQRSFNETEIAFNEACKSYEEKLRAIADLDRQPISDQDDADAVGICKIDSDML
ncbi:MAG: hypothetical protein AAFX00_00990 [Pseudomonadota bacterium]